MWQTMMHMTDFEIFKVDNGELQHGSNELEYDGHLNFTATTNHHQDGYIVCTRLTIKTNHCVLLKMSPCQTIARSGHISNRIETVPNVRQTLFLYLNHTFIDVLTVG